MAVIIGSARGDERGKAHGGKAGDQTGRELSTQNWYLHKKGWVVLRPKSPEAAKKVAKAMRAACANRNIGYDQYQRLTLYNACKPLGFDPGKVTTVCETDCSALVRVCCAYAGIASGNFTTDNQVSVLMATGAFEKLTDAAHTKSASRLATGDILVTKTKGHTAVVLNDGAKCDRAREPEPEVHPTLRLGATGVYVETMQQLLLKADKSALPRFGADGDFGAETETAVTLYQTARGLEVDGIVDPQTWAALEQTPEQKDYVKLLIKWGFENSIKTIGEKPTIKQFQSAMGLSVDGIVGPKTLSALNSEIIIPRLTQEDLICQCTVWYKDNPLCNGYPAGYGTGQGILILAERIFRRYEELYGSATFYVSSIAHDPSGYKGGWKGQIAGGNRCATWAVRRNSTITSRHVRGDAMDIWGVQDGVSKATVRSRLEKIALSMNISGGVGYGATYIVHIDNRGVKARWRY